MRSKKPANNITPSLEQVLRRGDVWRGHSRTFIAQNVVSSGIEHCDRTLLNNGWPSASMIELCLGAGKNGNLRAQNRGAHGGEWILLAPLIRHICQQQEDNLAVLLNPPATPFAPALIQANIPLEQLLVIESVHKQDFIAAFVELTRSAHCQAVLAWQPRQAFSYTELRKCQLACGEGQGLYFFFRPALARNHSSPAPLRLSLNLHDSHLQGEIFKQRGLFNKRSFLIELPEPWTDEHNERRGDRQKNRAARVLTLPANTGFRRDSPV